MSGTTPRNGRVLWSFMMSLDGFVAAPNHTMEWMTGFTVRPGVIDAYIKGTGAVLAGREGWDAIVDRHRPWGGAWRGPIFVLTHHPEDATPADDVTFLDCGPAEAVRIALDAAAGKDIMVFSPTIGAQLLELGLIDEIDIHIAPILLGDGIRLYGGPGSQSVPLHRLDDGDPKSAARVRYRPIATGAGKPA